MVPAFGSAVDNNWLTGVACKTITEVERDYQPYRVVSGGDEGPPVDVPSKFVEYLGNIFWQKSPWKDDCGAFSTVNDHSIIFTALVWLPKTVLTSGLDASDLTLGLVGELEAYVWLLRRLRRKLSRRKSFSITEKLT